MPNQGQPTVQRGSTGEAVRRAQRALRRTADLGVVVNGVFGPTTEASVRSFQQGGNLAVDGIVGPLTWRALPDGGAMPVLKEGSTGDVVHSLQQVLSNGDGAWNLGPKGVDGIFGPNTKASVEAFQAWAEVPVDGVVGELTWDASLHAAGATLESTVGLNFVVD
jgi:peptidoglycan hydrolase-like protein with peptidoglycan-binding domain